jgi:hypothetical protein
MKTRNNPFFPAAINELVNALATYWRDMSRIVDGKGELRESNEWHKSNAGAYKTLTSSSVSIAINLADSNNFRHTLTEDTTLAAPSNPTAGQAGVIRFKQHASSSKTLGFDAFWEWAGGTCPTIGTDADQEEIMSYVISPEANKAYCVWLSGFASCILPD